MTIPSPADAVQPEALWFGRGRAAAFGMLHRPAQHSTRGVIFCNALGFEGMLAHRAFRQVADDVTERGFWALRFDYRGEGDSDGGAWDPALVDAWLATIDDAVGLLRSRGVTDVRLVGFRMGATLATLYAASHRGVSGLVLWSPCVKGSAHAVELRALSRLSSVARPLQHVAAPWFPDDAMEVAAFELSGETLRAIGDIDLLETSESAPAVLVIDRDDVPANDALVAKLRDSGADVDHERMAGYEDFMTSSDQTSVIPRPVLERIATWLADSAPPLTTDRVANVAPLVETDLLSIDDPVAGLLAIDASTSHEVVEQPVWIYGRYFAVISRPAEGAPIRRTAVVLCNTGSLNRAGPGRLYVHLAWYWAALGFTVVRIDIGGCGDTADPDPRVKSDPLARARAEELREIIEWVRETTGFERIAAGGLCSGVYSSFHVARDGTPLDTVLLVNPATFYVSEGETPVEDSLASAHFLTRGFFNGRKWKLALRDAEVRRQGLRSVRRLLRKKAISGFGVLAMESIRNRARHLGLPVKATSRLAGDLEAIIGRGVKVFLVFSAEESAEQYFRTIGGPACEELAGRSGLDVEYVDGGDHVFVPLGARQELVERMTTYLVREHPVVSPGVPAVSAETQSPSGSQGPLGLSAL